VSVNHKVGGGYVMQFVHMNLKFGVNIFSVTQLCVVFTITKHNMWNTVLDLQIK
jgi:hypothetical protein